MPVQHPCHERPPTHVPGTWTDASPTDAAAWPNSKTGRITEELGSKDRIIGALQQRPRYCGSGDSSPSSD